MCQMFVRLFPWQGSGCTSKSASNMALALDYLCTPMRAKYPRKLYLTRSICYRLPVGLQVLDNRQGSYGTEHPVEFTQLRLTSDFESVCVTAPLSLSFLFRPSLIGKVKGLSKGREAHSPTTHSGPLHCAGRKEGLIQSNQPAK